MRVAVIGSGPNGLTAGLVLAEAGLDVTIFEASDRAGGGCRTDEFAGCRVDHCATVMPLMTVSPVMRALALDIDWLQSPALLAHPFDNRPAALLRHSVDATAAQFPGDRGRYQELFGTLLDQASPLFEAILRPLIALPNLPIARFGLHAIWSATTFNRRFRDTRLRGLFAGIAAHSGIPLDRAGSASMGLVLALAGHAGGWPVARGGASAVAGALADRFTSAGGRITCNRPIRRLDELAGFERVLFDTSAQAMAGIASAELPARFQRRMRRVQPGPGVFKIEWVIDGPVPWIDPECSSAATVHLGGEEAEIAASERAVWQGRVAEKPFVILTQPSIVDASRAPAGRQVVGAYCHVPTGYTGDATAAIEAQVERFAPGFAARVLARRITTPAIFEAGNPNLLGGDISGGAPTLGQLIARPYLTRDPYRTPNPKLFLGSASTPPGGGVHGMCGANAAESLLRSAMR